jgi:hypothetical protein
MRILSDARTRFRGDSGKMSGGWIAFTIALLLFVAFLCAVAFGHVGESFNKNY